MNESHIAKIESQAPKPSNIDQAGLQTIVSRLINDTSFEITSWRHQQLYGGMDSGSSIHRFSGEAANLDQVKSWSLIIKVLHPQPGSIQPSSWKYYKREADAYQSGHLDDLPGGIVAPRSLCVTEYLDGTCWIWLEDIKDDVGERWPLEHYGVVARHIGQFNGAYLTGYPMPDGNWLSSDWLRKYIATSAPAVEPLRDSLDHPIVRRWFPGDTSERFFQLWSERELYLDAMDKLPQTFCHFDLFRRNLFVKQSVEGCPQTIAIDWAYAGQGPIGADLLPLLLASIGFGEVGVDKLHTLDEIIFKGYLDGLRDVGWDGDPQQARLGYLISGMRYNLSDIGSWLTLIHDESLHEDFEQEIGRPIEDYFGYWGQISRPGYMLVEEARSIINKLG